MNTMVSGVLYDHLCQCKMVKPVLITMCLEVLLIKSDIAFRVQHSAHSTTGSQIFYFSLHKFTLSDLWNTNFTFTLLPCCLKDFFGHLGTVERDVNWHIILQSCYAEHKQTAAWRNITIPLELCFWWTELNPSFLLAPLTYSGLFYACVFLFIYLHQPLRKHFACLVANGVLCLPAIW